MKKKDEMVEDNSVEENDAKAGSTVLGDNVLGESVLGESEETPDEDFDEAETEIINSGVESSCYNEVPKTNEQNLADFINANPDIPVIPLVDGDVVTDQLPGYYTGKIGDVWMDEYFIAPRDQIFFKTHGDGIGWETAIFVRIEKPEK